MGYYSIYKIIKDLIFTFINCLKKLSKKTIIIIIIILLIILFSKNTFAVTRFADGPYDNLLNDTTIKKMYDTYFQLVPNEGKSYTHIYIDKQPTQYVVILYDYTFFKFYTDTSDNMIKAKNEALGNQGTIYYVYTADLQGNNRGLYSQSTSYGGATLTMGSISGFSYTNTTIYESLNSSIIWYPQGYITLPHITNISSDITSWNFEYLNIDGGSISPYFELNGQYYPFSFSLSINYNGTAYNIDITDYTIINENANTFSCSIPRLLISSLFNFNLNSDLSFALVLTPFNENGEYTTPTLYNLETYTFTLAQNDVDNINQDSLRYKITENSNTINNINSSINNNNISSNSTNDFSNIDNNLSINDNTSINTIFDNIYNAFTTKYNDNNIGYGYTLSLPIPFTDKTIDISPHTVYGRSWADLYQPENQYNYPGIQTIYRFVQTVWWFVIGLFILKDIRGMINKIAEGNIEDISSDVKKELL